MKKFACLYGCFLALSQLYSIEPNPPEAWLSNPDSLDSGVYVFAPSDPIEIVNEVLQEISVQTLFGNHRYAVLFQPGVYDSDLSIPVGAYTSIMGLGETPSDTMISAVSCQESGSLQTFWRSLENVHIAADEIYWASDRACPLRRVHLDGNLYLSKEDPASGGFIADSVIAARIDGGLQRQYLFRNCEMGSFDGGLWNFVFVGCQGVPEPTCVSCKELTQEIKSITAVPSTPLIAEKPYITCIEGEYFLSIPQLQFEKSGSSESDSPEVMLLDFSHVYVTAPTDGVNEINEKIADPDVEAIVLSPSIYQLDGTIVIDRENFTFLGIGFPTLVAATEEPCLVIKAEGVRVGGIILQAGSQALETKTLLTWLGDNTSGFLYDCFARSGRFEEEDFSFNGVDTFIQIDSSHVVCDNLWLWRADSDAIDSAVNHGDNLVNQALIVNGDNVVVYGLSAEHTLQDLVQWNGSNGQCYFFHAELPCDATQAYLSPHPYVAYRLGNQAAPHQAFGLGIYSNFYNPQITVQNGIKTPIDTQIEFTNSMTRYLDHYGGIRSVINGQGFSVNSLQIGPYPLCQFVSKTNPINSHRRRR